MNIHTKFHHSIIITIQKKNMKTLMFFRAETDGQSDA